MTLDNFRTIDLIWDKANKSIIKTIKTASSDTTGRYLSVKILDGGQEVTLNSAKLQLYWEHPNFNTSGTDDFNTVNNGGLFKMTFSDEMLTNIGELNAHLVLTLPDGKITSSGFPIEVFKGTNGGVVVPANGDGLVKQIDKKIDKGNVTLNDLTQEVKLAMTGGSVAVVGVDAVGTENVKDGAVTVDKTEFIKTGKNLFDKETVDTGYTIHPTGGNPAPNAAYSLSDYIKVADGETLTQNQGWVVAFFTKDKTLVPNSILGTANPSLPRTLTVPSGAFYMRSAVSNANVDTYQIEKGSTTTPYEPFELVYSGLRNTLQDRIQDEKLKFQDLLNNYNLKYFTVYNENSASGQPLETKLKIYSAFAFVKITGSDADKPHHIRYIARNHTEVGYRMIIERKDDTGWVQIIDTGTLRLTENEFGPTILKYSNANYNLEAHIDYRLFPESQWSGSLGNIRADGQFILQKNAFGVVVESGGGGGEAYDQRLNTTDNVTFNSVSSNSVNTDVMAIGGTLPKGTLSSPPTGLLSGDVWADTTDSATHPILRVML